MPCVVLLITRHNWNQSNLGQGALSLTFRQKRRWWHPMQGTLGPAAQGCSSSHQPMVISSYLSLTQKNPWKGYHSANHRSQPVLWIKSTVTNSCLELMFMAGFISCWKAGRIATPWNIMVPVTAGTINCRASSQPFGLSNKRKWLRGKFHHLSFVE